MFTNTKFNIEYLNALEKINQKLDNILFLMLDKFNEKKKK